MDVNTKVKELEDELKVLKTEIRNVLLDVREVILERANPLSEQEPAYLRVDLKTTAQAIAAEEAARSAAESAEAAARAAAKKAEETKTEEQPEDELEQPQEPDDSDGDGLPVEDELETEDQETGDEPVQPEPPEEPEEDSLPEPPPKAEVPRKRKKPPDAGAEPAEIPPAYRVYLPLAVGTGSLAAWVAEAMATIGPQQLDRVITIHRLWGCLPPNIGQALAHLQELIRCSEEAEPAWLKIMQDMERLSSS
jgi:hypothetical protein